MSRRPPQGPNRRPAARPPASGRPGTRPPVRQQYYAQAPDRTPLIVGGVVAVVLAALLIVFLVTNNNKGTTGTTGTTAGAVPTVPSAPQADTAGQTAPTAAPATGSDPPRISLETFKKLYDDPATRPPLYDVRAVESFQAGHIVGAQSFPESDVDTRFKEIPKDRLVVLYCQWPAENESARVAQKLHDTYGYSYDNLKVLLGGWNSWKNAGYPTEGTDEGAAPAPGGVLTSTVPLTTGNTIVITK